MYQEELEFNLFIFFFFQAEDGIRDYKVTGVQTCALPITQQAAPSVRQADAANAASPHAPVPASSAVAAVAPTAAAASPGSPQLLQSMTRDLATLAQEVEQLKASVEQLRAGQQQMSREVAK